MGDDDDDEAEALTGTLFLGDAAERYWCLWCPDFAD
jgi:hypothetical protein